MLEGQKKDTERWVGQWKGAFWGLHDKVSNSKEGSNVLVDEENRFGHGGEVNEIKWRYYKEQNPS
jgi:hypothetical protein